MANANQGQARGKVYHGARGYITYQGVPLAYCENVSGSIEYDMRPVDVLDNLETEEFVPVSYRVTLNARFVTVTDKSLIDRGIQVPLEDVLTSGEAVLEMKDRPTDTAQYSFEGVKFQRSSFDLAKGEFTRSDVAFVAKRVRDKDGIV